MGSFSQREWQCFSTLAILLHLIHQMEVPPKITGEDVIICYFQIGRSDATWQTLVRGSGRMGECFERMKSMWGWCGPPALFKRLTSAHLEQIFAQKSQDVNKSADLCLYCSTPFCHYSFSQQTNPNKDLILKKSLFFNFGVWTPMGLWSFSCGFMATYKNEKGWRPLDPDKRETAR